DEFPEVHLWFPAEKTSSFRHVTAQLIDFRGAKIARVDFDVPLPVDVHVPERFVEKVPNGMTFTRGNDEVVWPFHLEDAPHRIDVVLGETPISLRVQIAEEELVREPELDARRCARDLARNES